MSINPQISSVAGGVDPEQFKAFVGSFPTGVTVVTWKNLGGDAGGVTVNAFASISLDPPLIMVSLAEGSRALEPILEAGSFGVNILNSDGAGEASAFACRTTADLNKFPWKPGHLGNPLLLSHTEAYADCEIDSTYTVGDHVMVIGRVQQAGNVGSAPLGYLRRQFSAWQESADSH